MSPKKERLDLKKLLKVACENDENLIIMDITPDSAFLIKRITETIKRELCPGTMNPVEVLEEKNFFHAFMIITKPKRSKKSSIIGSLENKGFPIYLIGTEYDLMKTIKEA